MSVVTTPHRKKTVPGLMAQKGESVVSALTAYDFTMARLMDQAGVDMILVGDSLGNIIQGHDTTLPVTMDQMVYHCQCVARGAAQALVVGDLPFGSFQTSTKDTIKNAIRLVQEGGAAAVKLEGASKRILKAVRHLVEEGIPVVGHVGLTPQSVHAMGGFRKQGKDSEAAERILQEALTLEKAGAFAIVLECIPDELAATITAELRHAITIGIGAGNATDGQILVSYDLLGLLERSPSFAPRMAELGDAIHATVSDYVRSLQKTPEKKPATGGAGLGEMIVRPQEKAGNP
jgi:3-methyl-2-oxobutanoate hydroxymethyltransferase